MNKRLFCVGVFLILGVGWLPGCVTPSRANKMEEQISNLQSQQNKLADSMSANREEFQKMLTQAQGDMEKIQKVLKDATDLMQRNSADFGADFARFQQEFEILRGKVETLAFNLDKTQKDLGLFKEDVDLRFGSQVGAGVSGGGVSGGLDGNVAESGGQSGKGGGTLGMDPDTMLNQGKAFLAGGNSREAQEIFEAFVATFPGNERMDEAILGVGDALLQQKKAREAGKQYEKILSSYPKSKKLADAYFNLGDVFVQLGSCKDAAKFYDRVIKKFDNEALKARAKKRLQSIESGALCP